MPLPSEEVIAMKELGRTDVSFKRFILKYKWLIDSAGPGVGNEFYKGPCFPHLISDWWSIFCEQVAFSISCPDFGLGPTSRPSSKLISISGCSVS